MLGHVVIETLAEGAETYGTVRSGAEEIAALLPAAKILNGVTAGDLDTVMAAIVRTRPDVVVNCIGIVKQLGEAKDPVTSVAINSLFPHRLARLAEVTQARLIHISTDCVFSGRKGSYTEDEIPDPPDLYGRSKLLGEVTGDGAVTLRTSIIGRELHGAHGLVEWFLSQAGAGRVKGFRRAIFSGWTTLALARVIHDVIYDHPNLSGLWHVAAEPIDKYSLLSLVRTAFGLELEIDADDDFVIDRSLDGSRFREATGIVAPAWPDMIAELAAARGNYDERRELRSAGR
jgi:dTDP-4-dehydrorhamnose reductase